MGKEAIGKLVGLLAGRASKLRGVLIVTDADDDPLASFTEATKAFVDPFKPPTSSYVIHKGKKHKTGVYLTPGRGKTGELEHLLLEAVLAENPKGLECIDKLGECTSTMADWKPNKIAKMRMACYVASHCKNDPCCSLAYLWAKKNKVLDIANPAFAELGDFLVEFASDEDS